MLMTGPARRASVLAALLLLVSVALFWPGTAAYDTVQQFRQARSGVYDDWHPPIMARTWALLRALFGGGAGPMLAAQMGGYWLGLGLIAAALARGGRSRGATAVLAIGAWPPLLGWQAVVLKDGQMVGAMLAATGLAAWWRLRGERTPGWAWALVASLIGYAMLVRANAVFAAAPLAVMLAVRGGVLARAGATAALMAVVIVLSGPINHRLLGATPTSVVQVEAVYDLAGIAVRAGSPAGTGLSTTEALALVEAHCVKPFFWDPLGEVKRCEAAVEPLRSIEAGPLYVLLAGAILRHPIAYAEHRLAHLNSTARWLTPRGWPSAAPLQASEPNTLGLASPGGAAVSFQRAAAWLVETPLGWPVTWVAAALVAGLLALRRPPAPARDLALALLVSALALEASFAVLSIASDLRYHLWPMVATPLAIVLLGRPIRSERRTVLIGTLTVALVIAGGAAERLLLPPAPGSYRAMLEG